MSYVEAVTSDEQWVGNIGHLALADATLAAQLDDMRTVLAYAAYPAAARRFTGSTTKVAARDIQQRLEQDAALFPDEARAWLVEILDAADRRNQVLHAVALDRCVNCGAASLFLHLEAAKKSIVATKPSETSHRASSRCIELA